MARSTSRSRTAAGAALVLAVLAGCGARSTDVADPGADLAVVQAAPAGDPVVAVIDTIVTTTTVPPTTTTTRPPSPPSTAAATASSPRARPGLEVMGRLIIPAIGVDTVVYEGETLDVIDHGPGHFRRSARPGQVGNVVIAGHRVTHSKPFRNLDRLKPGDQLAFDVPSGRYIYEFTHHEIVTPDRVDITNQTLDYTATLFACHPPGSARYRIVARWKLVSPREPGQPDPATFGR